MRTVRIAWPEGQRHPSFIEETSGFAIQGIRRANLLLAVGQPPTLEAEIFVSKVGIDGALSSRFKMIHPHDGDFREVASITFADGSVVDL
ncbi:hypothetical protein [Pleomorphomonas sp. PLEO]|uniref:hypothetical protein n=1 Tax=Pleomorphomonas sp. PLEO TaxID=3239306 RepID=UPI00351DF9F4